MIESASVIPLEKILEMLQVIGWSPRFILLLIQLFVMLCRPLFCQPSDCMHKWKLRCKEK